MPYTCSLNKVLKDGEVVSTHLTIAQAAQERHRLENSQDFDLSVAVIGISRKAMEEIMDLITSKTIEAGGFVAGGFTVQQEEEEELGGCEDVDGYSSIGGAE